MNRLHSRQILLVALAGFGVVRADEPASGASSINLHAVIAPDSKKPEKPPAFHNAVVGETVVVTPDAALVTARIGVRVVQGEPEVVSFELAGDGDIATVTGKSIREWSVRRDAAGRRFLDLRPAPGLKNAGTLDAEVAAKCDRKNPRGVFSPLLLLPAGAVSSEVSLRVTSAEGVALRVTEAAGLVSLASAGPREHNYLARGPAKLTLAAGFSSEEADPVTLDGFRLAGRLTGDHAGFELNAVARVREAGASCVILAGGAALREIPADAGYRVRLADDADGRPVYRLEFDKPGDFPVKLAFDARVTVRGESRSLDFAVPAAQVAPYSLTGLDAGTEFETSGAAPLAEGAAFAGHLPPGGALTLAWRERTKTGADARLFFSTKETTEVVVGAGLVNRSSHVEYKILQGKLETIVFDLVGPGEVLRVTGDDILEWKIADRADPVPSGENAQGAPRRGRRLVVKLARPHTGDYALDIGMQNTTGVFPASFPPPGLSPEGAVNHGGLLRVTNVGAVRLEITPERALTQVSPSAFPSPARAGASQTFVYRVSSADAAYTVHADNILPEIAVSQVAVCTLGERDDTLDAELDVEIREAPLRELVFRVPPGFSTVSVAAPELADHNLVPGKSGAPGELRLSFGKPVSGRVLVSLRLEKNRIGEPDTWTLPALGFPGAKSVRGFVGVCAAPGYRLTPGAVSGLSEIADAYFPAKRDGLARAWRVREPDWSATMAVAKLDAAVQTDVLHQYAVREGSVAESTLVNYLVVGAPLRTLRFKIPKGAKNIEFAGGDIRGWKTTGDEAEVSLQRGVSGAFTLMATCELPLNFRGGSPDLSGIRPTDVQSDRGFVLVTSDRPFAIATGALSKNLSAVETGEIPPEYRMIADAPLLAAYRYSGGGYTLPVTLTPRGVAGTVSQVVDVALLETKVSREGGCVTTCRYLVKSRGHAHLRLRMPPELRLWSARVGGHHVVPVTEGPDILVPLPATEGPDAVIDVEVRVAQTGADAAVVEPAAPAPGAPVVRTTWTFVPDSGRRLLRDGGDMARISEGPASDGLADLLARLRTAGGAATALFVAAAAGLGLGASRRTERGGSRLWRFAGLLSLGAAAAGLAAGAYAVSGDATSSGLTLSSSVLEAGNAPHPRFVNLADSGFAFGAAGAGALALAGALLVAGVVRRSRVLRAAGWGSALAAPLFMPGGLPVALGAGALFLFCGVAASVPTTRRKGLADTIVAMGLLALIPFLPNRAEAGEPASADAVVAADARSVFMGRRWAWFANADAGPSGTLEFLENGRCRFTGDVAGWLTGWEPAGVGKIKVKHDGSGYWIFEYKPSTDEAESIAGEGSIDAGKILRPLAVPAGVTAAESVRQVVKLSAGRVESSGTMRVSGRAGDRFDLISGPAVLTDCRPPDGVRLAHRTAGGTTILQLVLDRDGAFAAPFSYVMPLDDGRTGFPLPTGRAAADALSVESADTGLVFSGAGVVSVSPDSGASGSAAALVYAPVSARSLGWAPKTRDARAEKLVFYAEVANLFVPSPGVLEGRHTVRIRPARGVVRELTVAIPKGLTVSGVTGEAVGTWRHDPETGSLHVSTDYARSAPFEFRVDTQAALGALPALVRLAPPAVRDAAGSVGLVGLASGDEVRFDSIAPEGLSPVNTDDFPVPASPDGGKVVVRRAFRSGTGPASVTVRLAAVEPEVRVHSRQTLSVGDDRVTLNAILDAEILRAGLFRLSFRVPDGYDIESVGGAALAHWAEVKEGGARTVVMNLRGRTLGGQRFTVSLSGPGVSGKTRWTPPKLVLNEAARLDGEMLVVPEEGLRLRPAVREGATPGVPAPGTPRGASVFRLSDSGYTLAFDVENAAPWIRCDWLQDVAVLDGRIRGTVTFDYAVENAAVRSLRVRLPEDAEGVRFAGELVSDAAPVTGKPGEWDVKLSRRTLGKVGFNATFRLAGAESGRPAMLKSAGPLDAGASRGWVALRFGGRLSPGAETLPEALRPEEWSGVPVALRRGLDEAARTLRVVDPDFTLPLAVTTHDPAKLPAVRVKSAALDSALAADGRSLTTCRLELALEEKRPLRLVLPAGFRLWQVFVNNRAVSPAFDGGAIVVPVEPNPADGAPATLEVVYEGGSGGALKAPGFDLPLENIRWRVGLPVGTRLSGWSGEFVRASDAENLPTTRTISSVSDAGAYTRANEARLLAAKRDADELLRLGGKYRAAGDQERAQNALSLARSLSQSDAALNEDARVQYGNLRADQIEFGLNRRRAQVIRDNGVFRSETGPDEGAAGGLLANRTVNFTAEDADRLRAFGGGEDRVALRRLAERLAGMQQAGTTLPDGIRTVLPESDAASVFTRSLYDASSDAPLAIDIRVTDTQRSGRTTGIVAWLVLVLGAAGLSRMTGRKTGA